MEKNEIHSKASEILEHVEKAKETQDAQTLNQALDNIQETAEETIEEALDMPADPEMCPGGCGKEIPPGCSYACNNCWRNASDEEKEKYRNRQS